MAQRFRKVTPGSPGDTQLSTYFVETDVVITADKQETQRRMEAALRAAFNAPPKPQSEMKLGKPRGKKTKSLAKRRAVK